MRNPHVKWKANKQFAFALQTPSGSLFSWLHLQFFSCFGGTVWQRLWQPELAVTPSSVRRIFQETSEAPALTPYLPTHRVKVSFLNEAGKWKWSFQPSDTSPSQQLSVWKWRVGLIFLLQNNEQQQKTNKQKTRSPRYLTKFAFIYTLKNSLVLPTSHSTKLSVGKPAHTWSIDLLAGNIRKWWGGRRYRQFWYWTIVIMQQKIMQAT